MWGWAFLLGKNVLVLGTDDDDDDDDDGKDESRADMSSYIRFRLVERVEKRRQISKNHDM